MRRLLVHEEGLEPPHLAVPEPKSGWEVPTRCQMSRSSDFENPFATFRSIWRTKWTSAPLTRGHLTHRRDLSRKLSSKSEAKAEVLLGHEARAASAPPWRVVPLQQRESKRLALQKGLAQESAKELCYGTNMAESSLSERERWALVNARLREEARQAGMETKLVQLAALMASVDDFGWRESLSDDAHVWELWTRLRNVDQATRVDATASSGE